MHVCLRYRKQRESPLFVVIHEDRYHLQAGLLAGLSGLFGCKRPPFDNAQRICRVRALRKKHGMGRWVCLVACLLEGIVQGFLLDDLCGHDVA